MKDFKSAVPHQLEIDFFDRYYEGQAYNPLGWRLRLNRDLQCLLKMKPFKRLGRVLSIGCGDGEFERMMAPWADKIVAVDISPQGIEIAQKNAQKAGIKNIEFRCQHYADVDSSEPFDTIVVLAFLHHVPQVELQKLLELSFTQLKSGGIFYSQDPNCHGILRKIGKMIMGAKYHKYHTPGERELDPAEMLQGLRKAGFERVRIKHIDLTLIPGLFLLAKRAGWPLYFCWALDFIWCHSPLARWSSGFVGVGYKSVVAADGAS